MTFFIHNFVIEMLTRSGINFASLQGGKFDHADRLFHSVEGAYRNCLTNTSDVKELIPEFFYLPEFALNTNDYYLGEKQDGELLSDVVLPAWAKVGIC